MYVVLSALLLFLVVGALVDIIMAEQWRIKHLDKVFWIIIVILLPLIGSILWFAIGRDYAHPIGRGGPGSPRRREEPAPGVTASPRDDSTLSKTERELAALEREIEASEKADRIRRLEEQLRARRRAENSGE